jgi:ferric-dicitrate binding protein FerR (iron transport regulator)/tetratricopeptide (TPR) repeat protein
MSASFVHVGGPTEDALFDWVAGRLHPQAADWIAAHVDGCVRCTRLAEQVRDVRRALEPPPEEPFTRQRAIHAVKRRLERPRRRVRSWAVLGAGAAACAALVTFLALRKHDVPQLAKAEPWSVLAREGAADVELGDEHTVAQANVAVPERAVLDVKPESRVLARWGGARVIVGGGAQGARIRLEASRADERRIKLERGRVVLDVDPLAPGTTLAVVTDDARVTVRGTRFLVERSAEGTSVAVERGLVRVVAGGRTIDVGPGQALAPRATAPSAIDADAQRALGTIAPLASFGAVTESLDVFADTPGADVWVDGVPHGRAPLSLAVTPGVHRVRVTASGRLPADERLNVVAGTPTLYRAELGELKAELAPPATPPRTGAPRPGAAAGKHEPPRAVDFGAARAEVLAGQYDRAITDLEALRKKPLVGADETRALLLEAQAYRLSHRPERAVPLLEKVARATDHDAEQGVVLLAQTLGRDLGDARRAAEVWAESLSRFPRGMFREEAAFRLGESLLDAGETLNGVQALEKYLASFASGAHADDAHLLVAAARRDRLGDCAGAVPHLRAVADGKAGPRAEVALIGEARCLGKIGRVDEARALYQRYLSQSPRGRFADEARAAVARATR